VFFILKDSNIFTRANTVLNMMVIVKHTGTSTANTLNSVHMVYDVTVHKTLR